MPVSDESEPDEVDGYFIDDEIESFHNAVDYSGVSDPLIDELLYCYLNISEIDILEENPLSFQFLAGKQQEDNYLLALKFRFTDQYVNKTLDPDVRDIICYIKPGNIPTQWQNALPTFHLYLTVFWFHQVLGHPGEKLLRETLVQCYYHSQLCNTIDKYKCEHFQKHKLSVKGYGLLPERDINVTTWNEVAIDLIGPWKIKVNGRVCIFNALTCIDTATNLVEMI